MGFFDSLFGGSKSKDSLNKRRSGEILLEFLSPGFLTGDQRVGAQNRGVSGELTDFLGAGGRFSGYSSPYNRWYI